MILSVVEVKSACSKPPAGVGLHISTGERRGFGALVPSLTRVPSLHFVKTEDSVNCRALHGFKTAVHNRGT